MPLRDFRLSPARFSSLALMRSQAAAGSKLVHSRSAAFFADRPEKLDALRVLYNATVRQI
jgi:hypothetical protein